MKRETSGLVTIALCLFIVLIAAFSQPRATGSAGLRPVFSHKPLHTAHAAGKKHEKAGLKTKTTKTTKTTEKPLATTLPANQKVAYLTFDDGPSEITPRLLDILAKEHVKATFFVVANSENTERRRTLIGMEAAAGHTVGVHSFTHIYSYIYASESNFLTDFDEMKAMIVQATGVEPTFCRFPGGTNNTVSITAHHGVEIMPKLLEDVKAQGFTPVDWNAGALDATYPVPDSKTIVNGVASQCRYLTKAIILLHDSAPHLSSVEAVPGIIKRLRAMGFVFEPLTSSVQAVTFKPTIRTIKRARNTAIIHK
jgi:peptidoglycan-N-acetylglucosamine deacetylase